MRFAALVTISIFCSMTGNYFADRLNSRVLLLEKTESMISYIRSQISYVQLPATELINLLNGKTELKQLYFIKECSECLLEGDDFPDAWKKSVNSKFFLNPLKRQDIQIILSFGENFGITDLQGQLSNCDMHLELLKLNREQAIKTKEQYSGLIRGLGFLTGIGIIIVFL